jgi:hypothetical protein
VEEEADESAYWLELLVDSGIMPPKRLAGLQKEANEIVAMTVASTKTLRARGQRERNPATKPRNARPRIENPKSKIQKGRVS